MNGLKADDVGFNAFEAIKTQLSGRVTRQSYREKYKENFLLENNQSFVKFQEYHTRK